MREDFNLEESVVKNPIRSAFNEFLFKLERIEEKLKGEMSFVEESLLLSLLSIMKNTKNSQCLVD